MLNVCAQVRREAVARADLGSIQAADAIAHRLERVCVYLCLPVHVPVRVCVCVCVCVPVCTCVWA